MIEKDSEWYGSLFLNSQEKSSLKSWHSIQLVSTQWHQVSIEFDF